MPPCTEVLKVIVCLMFYINILMHKKYVDYCKSGHICKLKSCTYILAYVPSKNLVTSTYIAIINGILPIPEIKNYYRLHRRITFHHLVAEGQAELLLFKVI